VLERKPTPRARPAGQENPHVSGAEGLGQATFVDQVVLAHREQIGVVRAVRRAVEADIDAHIEAVRAVTSWEESSPVLVRGGC
jgi:hypothetical protein